MKLHWHGVYHEHKEEWEKTYNRLKNLKGQMDAIKYWNLLRELDEIRKNLMNGKVGYAMKDLEDINKEINVYIRDLHRETTDTSPRPLFC